MARSLNVILVVDVESTCWEGTPPPGQASVIIEIGLCPVDLKTLTRIEKRSLLVKPVQSELSGFCTELTPEMFTNAGSLAEAVRTLKKEFHFMKDEDTVRRIAGAGSSSMCYPSSGAPAVAECSMVEYTPSNSFNSLASGPASASPTRS